MFPFLIQGKSPQFVVPVDTPHDFAYTPDIGRAAIALIDADDDCFNQAWHVPCAATRTAREIVTIASQHLGKKTVSLTVIPFWLLGICGWFSTFMAEVKEMGFTWTVPYRVNAEKFARKFNFEPTPFDVGVLETLRSFQ